MAEKELHAEIVKSGTWLYDNQVPHEVWIVRQNFDYYYEEGYEDAPEKLNTDGEVFHVVIGTTDGWTRGVEPAKMSLDEAIIHAESKLKEHQLIWNNPHLQAVAIPY